MIELNSKRGSCSGFTLVELLLAVTLVGGIVLATSSIYFYGVKTFQRGGDAAQKQQEARFLAQALAYEIRYAKKLRVYSAEEFANLSEPIPPGYAAIYSEDGIIYLDEGEARRNLGGDSQDLKSSVEFTVFEGEPPKEGQIYPNMTHLDLTITVSSKMGAYPLETSIIILNAWEQQEESSGTVLRYQSD